MPTHRPLTFLHISDIQVRGAEQQLMLDSLLLDLSQLRVLYGLQPKIIIASGDLAERGEETEFNKVSAFLSETAQRLSLTTRDVIIVPGNHDINWPSCKKHFTGLGAAPLSPFAQKWTEFAAFFNKFYGMDRLTGFDFTLDQPWTLFAIDSIKTVFAGINSTWEESHRVEDHHGCIGAMQFLWFEERLQRYRNHNWLRVGVLHHNISSEGSDDSALRDGDDFFKYIFPNVNLVLHGHTHLGVAEQRDGVPILSTGSATVGKLARPAEVPNQYQVIQIWPTHYQRWARSYSKVRGNWIGDCSISRSGNSWHERVPNKFKLVTSAFRPMRNEVFGHTIGFIESGDVVSSLALMSKVDNRNLDRDFLACILLKQKFGIYVEADLATLDEKIGHNIEVRRDAIWLDLLIVRLKLFSQEQEFEAVDRLFERLRSIPELEPRKRRGIIHRYAISQAMQFGFSKAEPYFSEALKISHDDSGRLIGGGKNEHSILTTRVLSTIAAFFCGAESCSKDDTVGFLKEAQEGYLGAEYEFQIGQAFPAKSTFQALFAEAAVFLYDNPICPRGWNRLIAAHLLISRCVITPRAEGYADTLSMIFHKDYHHIVKRDPNQREIRERLRQVIELAMYSEDSKRKIFLDGLLRKAELDHLLVPMSEIYDLVPLECPRPHDWRSFREFLTDLDERADAF